VNLEKRKLEFIQEFLKLQNKEAISRMEAILKKEIAEEPQLEDYRRIKEELNQRIEQSESDFRNNRYKTSEELLSKLD
jgi:hypothetical protein